MSAESMRIELCRALRESLGISSVSSVEELRREVEARGLDIVLAPLGDDGLYACVAKRVEAYVRIVDRVEIERELGDVRCSEGALEAYVGIVKGFSKDGAEVRGMEILREVYSDALLEHVARIAASMSGASRVKIVHREGFAGVGEPILLIACCAETRFAARECVSKALDMIKLLAPLTKVEVLVDGSRRIVVAGLSMPVET